MYALLLCRRGGLSHLGWLSAQQLLLDRMVPRPGQFAGQHKPWAHLNIRLSIGGAPAQHLLLPREKLAQRMQPHLHLRQVSLQTVSDQLYDDV